MNLQDLKAPFPAEDIEWRISRAGKKNGKVWAKVLAYATNRAIMDRLDDVFGPEHWQNTFHDYGSRLACGIGIRIEGSDYDWVWKWDGAGALEARGGLSVADAGKGDFSNAMKRAAVQWGIGRYLYNLDEGWADVGPDGAHYGRLPKDKGGDSFRWDPPKLPAWALPTNGKPDAKAEDKSRDELKAMGEALDEMGSIGSGVDEMHDAVDQFLAGTGWTDDKKAAAKDWLYTRVTKIDSNR